MTKPSGIARPRPTTTGRARRRMLARVDEVGRREKEARRERRTATGEEIAGEEEERDECERREKREHLDALVAESRRAHVAQLPEPERHGEREGGGRDDRVDPDAC